MAKKQDTSYRDLFSSPRMVRDLIHGFVPDQWLQSLDYSTLEKMPTSFVTDDLRDRCDDIIWRVKVGTDWVYLYLLIEFQSTIDKYMALRMMVYVGLLYQDLIKSGQIPKGGKLPPVLPLVLYNGARRWKAATELSDLIAPVPGLVAQFRPQMHYLLIDEGAFADHHLASLRNLVATVFRLEYPDTPQRINELIRLLDLWLGDEPELRRMFASWIRATLIRQSKYTLNLPELQDLKELDMALAQRMQDWAQTYRQEGVQVGLQEGLQEGREEGRQEGRQEGEAMALKKMLVRRFGAVSPDNLQKISTASAADIDQWLDRILDAPSVEHVFTPKQH